jgi:hypothetical protein
MYSSVQNAVRSINICRHGKSYVTLRNFVVVSYFLPTIQNNDCLDSPCANRLINFLPMETDIKGTKKNRICTERNKIHLFLNRCFNIYGCLAQKNVQNNSVQYVQNCFSMFRKDVINARNYSSSSNGLSR